jgi:hypothetical protein
MITLSVADAICPHTCGFRNVEPGRWRVQTLPPELRWRYRILTRFASVLIA